jgi:hypothetical protein
LRQLNHLCGALKARAADIIKCAARFAEIIGEWSKAQGRRRNKNAPDDHRERSVQ